LIIKRKFGDRSDWNRILEKDYSQAYIQSDEFQGYITMLTIKEVTDPLWTVHDSNEICVLDMDYVWLQHFPENEHHSITTVFDENGEIVQWYIDICLKNDIENNTPYMDDLFLDIILLPSGKVIEKDKDEIEKALSSGIISQNHYEMAWKEFNKLCTQIRNQEFVYITLSQVHKKTLEYDRKKKTPNPSQLWDI